MSFLKGPRPKDIAAHPLPASSVISRDVPAAGDAPDFGAMLGRLRRSFLDLPVDSTTLKATVGLPMSFLRVARVPRRIDEQGRSAPAGADRERLLLTALHGLGQPLSLRVENRAAELHVGLGIVSLGASDTLGRFMTCSFLEASSHPWMSRPCRPGAPWRSWLGLPSRHPRSNSTRRPISDRWQPHFAVESGD